MSSPLKTYRVYSYDSVQHVVSSDIIEASDDEDVIAQASSPRFTRCEIWDGNRLVAQLEGERRQA